MNTRTTITLALSVLLLILLTGGVFVFTQKRDTGTLPQDPFSNIFPFASQKGKDLSNTSSSITQTADTVEVKTTNGTIRVSDFLNDPDVASSTDSSFFLSWSPGSEATSTVRDPAYEFYYLPESSFFIVVLLKEPIGETRRKATDDFKLKLGISDADLCTLNTEVNTPYYVNDFYAAKNLGFPGCSGSFKFEGDPAF